MGNVKKCNCYQWVSLSQQCAAVMLCVMLFLALYICVCASRYHLNIDPHLETYGNISKDTFKPFDFDCFWFCKKTFQSTSDSGIGGIFVPLGPELVNFNVYCRNLHSFVIFVIFYTSVASTLYKCQGRTYIQCYFAFFVAPIKVRFIIQKCEPIH